MFIRKETVLHVILLTTFAPDTITISDQILIGVYDEKHRINGMDAIDDYCNRHDLQRVLAECLREPANSYTIQTLLREFSTMQALMNATEPDLMEIRGIGKCKAKRLSAILDFVRYTQ